MSSTPAPSGPRGQVERLIREGLIEPSVAAKLVKAKTGTIARWYSRGITLPGGRVLRLEAVRVGGRVMTTEAALFRFIEQQQDEPPETPA